MLQAQASASAHKSTGDRHMARVFYDNGAYSVVSVVMAASGFDEEQIVAQSRKACGWRMDGCAVLKVTIDIDPSVTIHELAPLLEVAAVKRGQARHLDTRQDVNEMKSIDEMTAEF